MRILILGFTKMKFMPYVNFYLSNIDKRVNEIHIIYWNRDCKKEDLLKFTQYALHEFVCYQEDDVSKISKIKNFYKYSRFVRTIIAENKFDKLIVLHTLPAILLYDVLRKYRGRYILDYRDSTYEYYSLFKYLVANIVKWSEITFVSSDAFRKYLPSRYKAKIYTSHNILEESLLHQEDKERYGVASGVMRIAFWGFIRHEDVNKAIILRLAGDSRFELHYYGREQQVAENLKIFAKDVSATNVFFHGEYNPTDRYEFIKNTECIHNIYYDKNMMLAMGNKYYDGIIFRIPQVCMPESYMGQMCETHNVGTVLNPYDDTFADKLFDYLTNLNIREFQQCCKVELNRIIKEYEQGKKMIASMFVR